MAEADGHDEVAARDTPVNLSAPWTLEKVCVDVVESGRMTKDLATLMITVSDNAATDLVIEQIGRETGIRPAGQLLSDSLTPANGRAPTYVAMMRANTQAMIGAIQGR